MKDLDDCWTEGQGGNIVDKKPEPVDWRGIARLLAEELRWCSGSPDFNPGGQARVGWVKGPQVALADFDAAVNQEAQS